MTSNPYVIMSLYFCCVFLPIVVYVYAKKIKRGIVLTTLSEIIIIGLVAIILTYNYNVVQLIILVGLQVGVFVFVIGDAINVLRKKEEAVLK